MKLNKRSNQLIKLIILSMFFPFFCNSKVIIKTKVAGEATTSLKQISSDSVFIADLDTVKLKYIKEIGSLEIKDIDFSLKKLGLKDGSYFETLEFAKRKAAEIGGNLLIISNHKLPSNFGSSCHGITAKIYYSEKPSEFEQKSNYQHPVDSLVILKIYRQYLSSSAFVNFNLYLNDKQICKVKGGIAETVIFSENQIGNLSTSIGLNNTATSVSFRKGHVYYIRCFVDGIGYSSKPTFEINDNNIKDAMEWNSLKK